MILGVAAAIPALALAVIVLFRIPISLNFYRAEIAASLESLLGRKVAIGGSIDLRLGMQSGLRVDDFEIMNPVDWPDADEDGSLVKIDRIQAEVDLLPLLRRRIDIDLIEVDGVKIDLAESAEGAVNWKFDDAAFSRPKGGDAVPAADDGFAIAGMEGVAIRDLELTLTDAAGKRKSLLKLDELTGSGGADKPMALAASGSCFGRRITASLGGGTRNELMARENPWPFRLKGKFGLAEFTHEGRIPARGASKPERYRFQCDIPSLDELEPVTGPLPDAGALSFSGEMQFEKAGFKLPQLSGTLGKASFAGHFAADFSGAAPRIDGSMTFDSLEVAKLRGSGGGGKSDEVVVDFDKAFKHDVDAPEAGEDRALFSYVGRLEVAAGHLIGIKHEARDVSLVLDTKEDGASLQASAMFAKSRFEATAGLSRAPGKGLELDVKAESANVDVAELLPFFSGDTGVTGRTDSLAFRYKGAGENWKEIREHAESNLATGKALLTIKRGGESVDLRLEPGSLTRNAAGEREIAVSGVFKEETFSVKGTFVTGKDQAGARLASCDLKAAGAGATILIQRAPGEEGYALSVAGDRLADLSPWIGAAPRANIAYAAKGRLFRGTDGGADDGWRVASLEGSIGEDRFSGALGRSAGGANRSGPVLKIDLKLATVDVEAIKHAFKVPKEKDGKKGGFDIDLPILPGDLHIADADLKIVIQRLLLERDELTGVQLEATLRDGWVQKAPFEASFGEARFHGNSTWDFRGGAPKADFDLTAEKVILGRLLGDLGVVLPVADASTEYLNLTIHARGGTLREILRQSAFEATLQSGTWKLRDSNTKGEVNLAFDEATISAPAGEPLRFELKGQISDAPVTFSGQTDGVTAFAEGSQDMQLRFEATLAGTKLRFDEKVTLPLDRSDFNGDITLEARSLSDLNELIDVHLPPWGPYRLKTHLRIIDDGYSFENFDATVGESDFSGTLQIHTRGAPPRFTGNLKSRRFQIVDFHKEGWSPYGPSGSSEASFVPGKKLDAIHSGIAAILSPGVLASFNGKLSLAADAVYSHRERLGDGSLVAELENGKLRLAPASLNIPGGSVRFEFAYAHRAKQIEADISIKVADFDIGIMARHKDPSSKAAATTNFDARIKSLSPVPGKFFAYGNGQIDFSICPEHYGADVFDLWATNLLVAIIPKLDPERKSKVNCVLGEFTLADGVLKTDKFLIDATRVRSEGSGTVDFKREIVDLTLIPRAKTPQLLNLATAITIDGTFDKVGKRVTAADAINTVSGSAARTVLFPLRFLTEHRMPEDGSDICPCLKSK